MAKISGGTTLPLSTVRLKAFGRFTIVEFRGKMVAKSWPRPRGKIGTPAQMEARAAFTKMVRAVQDMMPEDVAMAHELAKGTAYTYRDYLSALVNGTLGDVPGVDMITTQAALDAISDEPGTILFRGPDAWVGLAPGFTDQVLTMGTLPEWQDPTPPTGSGAGWQLDTLDASPTDIFGSNFRTYLGLTRSGADGTVHDIFAIAKRVTNTKGVGIMVTNPALSAGYMWDCQADGNVVLYRYLSGALTALRATGAGINSAQVGTQIMRMTIACYNGKCNLLCQGITPFTDSAGPNFNSVGLRLGIFVETDGLAQKLGYNTLSGI